jgi:hypothetical protein
LSGWHLLNIFWAIDTAQRSCTMEELCMQMLDLQTLAVKRFGEESAEQVGE